ncbi:MULTISPECIES: response regulator [unclassified Luteimonas]
MALRVLIIDDSRDDAELTEFALREAGLVVDCRNLCREDALAAALDGFEPQLVLCDLNLPGWSGPEAMAAVRSRAPWARFVFVTGALPFDRKLPDDDVVLKDDLARLVELARAIDCSRVTG